MGRAKSRAINSQKKKKTTLYVTRFLLFMPGQALAKGEMDFDSTYGGSLGEGEAHPLRSGLWSCHTEFMTMWAQNSTYPILRLQSEGTHPDRRVPSILAVH